MATPAAEQNRNGVTTFGSVAVGAMTVVAVGTTAILFGGGFGLIRWDEYATLRFEHFFPGTALKTVALAVLSYFCGGFAAARWSAHPGRTAGCGVGTWAVATTALVLVAIPPMMTLVPAVAAGTKPGITALVETIESLRPRILSDMSLLKGKVVSTMDLQRPKKSAIDQAEEETHRAKAKLDAAATAYAAERFQLLGFAALLFGVLAAIAGAWFANGPNASPRTTWRRLRAVLSPK